MATQGSTVQDWIAWGTQQLLPTSESAKLDAEILLAHCLQTSRTWLFTWPDTVVDRTVIVNFQQCIHDRVAGMPVAYLTGQRAFWSLTLKVTPDTLIPRPDTELLVDTALSLLPRDNTLSVLDLGTGTGAIALAIASERPDSIVTACDVSPAALAIARENARDNNVPNVRFQQSDWFSALPTHAFDLIVSNPPYIAENDPHLTQGDVRFEPLTALTSGKDGLDALRKIVQEAPDWLKPGAWLLLEHGFNQGESVTDILREKGFRAVRCLPDLAGNDRVSMGQMPD